MSLPDVFGAAIQILDGSTAGWMADDGHVDDAFRGTVHTEDTVHFVIVEGGYGTVSQVETRGGKGQVLRDMTDRVAASRPKALAMVLRTGNPPSPSFEDFA
jgi:hypothetical protein